MEASGPYLPQEMVELLTSAVVTGYDTGSDLHDASRGSNASTFGIGAYHFGIFQLEKLARERPELIQIVRAGKMARIRIGNHELGYYKIKSPDGHIDQAFPSSKNAAYPITDNIQRPLFDDDLIPTMEADDRRYLILAHVGNSSDGLQKLYLCEPGKVMDGMIVGWAGYQEIYNQTTDLAPAPVMESRGEAAPTEVVEDFELKPKAAKQTRSIPSKA